MDTDDFQLQPLNGSNIGLAAEWLSVEENYKWLDFGLGRQVLSLANLKLMSQRDIHVLRVFTEETGRVPIGMVVLSDINRRFKTALLWYVLGNKNYGGAGYTSRAVLRILDIGFRDLSLKAIQAWAIEVNRPSIRILEKAGFRFCGRLRNCHFVDGEFQDRLLFDLLASEHAARADR